MSTAILLILSARSIDLFALDKRSGELSGALDSLEAKLVVASILVGVGVVIESWPETVEFWHRLRWPMASFPHDKLWAVIGGLLVAVGVIGEFVYTGNISGKEHEFRDNSGQIEAVLNTATAAANQRTAELQSRILDIFGPRKLTPEQSADIVKHLAGLKRVKIDIYVLALGNPSVSKSDSDDPTDFARTVVGILRDGAHMDAEGWLVASCFGGSASGFNVSLHLPGSDGDRKIASEVLNAFRPDTAIYREVVPSSSGDFCQKFSPLDPSRPNRRKHDAAVSITIGTKVQPILTREMLEPSNP
jgi:hypothetical protein